MNELFIVWGPPHSGQLRWMCKDFEASSEYNIRSVVLPLTDFSDEGLVKSQLAKIESQIAAPTHDEKAGYHIFCEMPWKLLDEDLDLEDWVENTFKKFAFRDKSPWNLNFICICPFEAHKLPRVYREGLENFSRASQSVVVVVKREAEPADPVWLQNESIDFGRHVEILEDFIWPLQGELALGSQGAKDFSEKDAEFVNFELPLAAEKTQIRNLLIEFSKGTFGKFWGAEASWRNEKGQFEALSLSENRLFSWVSDHPSLVEMSSLNGARVTASGFEVTWDLLKKAVGSFQRFC
jgi:hypothetical protein